MSLRVTAASVLAAIGLAASAAAAQVRTLQFDVNNVALQAQDASGAPTAFGGVSHTGSLVLSDSAGISELVGLAIRTGSGPFMTQAGTFSLTDFAMTIDMSNGMVTGGSLLLDVNGGPSGGGDRYTANIGNAGAVTTFVGGGFKVEGLTDGGMFSDGIFGTVDISDFFNNQGSGGLPGSFLAFRIDPSPNGSGFADIDIFVTNVPTPGTLACIGGAALLAVRRRRR